MDWIRVDYVYSSVRCHPGKHALGRLTMDSRHLTCPELAVAHSAASGDPGDRRLDCCSAWCDGNCDYMRETDGSNAEFRSPEHEIRHSLLLEGTSLCMVMT